MRLFLLISLALTAATASAQLPTDNFAWKSRCSLLAAQSAAITSGITPPTLIAATRSVPAVEFYAYAVNRAQAKEHNVACTLYFLAAIASRYNPKPDLTATKNNAILATTEYKLARKQKLTIAEHLKRGEMKVEAVASHLDLNADQSAAVLNAATTMPITLTK